MAATGISDATTTRTAGTLSGTDNVPLGAPGLKAKIAASALLEGLANVTADAAAVRAALGAEAAGAAAAAQAASQPLDADLTAIAGLSTQAFGRSLLTGSTALAVRTLLGVPTSYDVTVNGVSNDMRYATANISNGSAVVTMATGTAFSAADVGKLVVVPTANLIGTIQTVNTGTNSATLDATSGSDISGAATWIGTDNTTPMQSLATASPVGAEFFFPPGKYLFNGEVTFKNGQKVVGSGYGTSDDSGAGGVDIGTLIQQAQRTSGNLFSWPGNSVNGGVRNVFLSGGLAGGVPSQQTAVNPGFFGNYFKVDDIRVANFSRGVATAFTSHMRISGCHIGECRSYGIQISGGSDITIENTCVANCDTANLKIDNGAGGVAVRCSLFDESGDCNIWIENAYRVLIDIPQIYTATQGAKDTIRIGNSGGTGVVEDVFLRVGKIEPFNPGASSGGTVIHIYSGAVRVNLGCGTPILATANTGGTVLTDGGSGTLGSVTTV